jgi:hypothetical protein
MSLSWESRRWQNDLRAVTERDATISHLVLDVTYGIPFSGKLGHSLLVWT